MGSTGFIAVFGLLTLAIVLQVTLDSFLPFAKGDSTGMLILKSPIVTDARSDEVLSPVAGQQLFLSTTLANSGRIDIQFLLLTEIRDETGVTIMLDSRWGVFTAGESPEVHHTWRPENVGTFELRSFVISADCFLEILTAVNVVKLVVVTPDGNDPPVPRFEDLSEEQIQQLTREEIAAIEFEADRRYDIESEAFDAEDLRLETQE